MGQRVWRHIQRWHGVSVDHQRHPDHLGQFHRNQWFRTGAGTLGRIDAGSQWPPLWETYLGGTSNKGTLFELTTSGVLTTLANFTGTNGALPGQDPDGSLAVGTDGNFYGTTLIGGISNKGTLFELTTNGVATNLLSFTITNGSSPRVLTLGPVGNLYGTTFTGGNGGGGFVYEYVPPATPPTITTDPASACVPNGYAITFNAAAAGTAPLAYQWSLNGSAVGGGTGSNLAVTAATGTASSYTMVVTNIAGSVTSSPAVLTIGQAPSFFNEVILNKNNFQYSASNSPFTIPGRILTVSDTTLYSNVLLTPMTNWLTWSNLPAGPLKTIQFTTTNNRSGLQFFRLAWP
jgi:uncharacterized repeat protein (TIGR03803 family)